MSRGHQVHPTNDVAMPPPTVNLTQEQWLSAPDQIRCETVRAYIELTAGIAIAKDRMMGRAKRDRKGFFGLCHAEHTLWRLRSDANSKPGDVALWELEIAALRESLASDEAEVARRQELVEVAEQIEKDVGMPFKDWLARCIDIENTLRRDAVGGLIKVCDAIGVDFFQMLQAALDEPVPAVRH